MQNLQFSTTINASRETVWHTLWDDRTFRDWAGIIDEGTYLKGELKEGNEVQFISAVNGYGVTSLVEKLIPNEFISMKHKADTKDSGEALREKEWTGGGETYSLVEHDGVTTLTYASDIPAGMEELFEERIPKALERIKVLAEK